MTSSPLAEPRRERVGRVLFWIAAAATIIGWGPLFCTLAASWFASLGLWIAIVILALRKGWAGPCVGPAR